MLQLKNCQASHKQVNTKQIAVIVFLMCMSIKIFMMPVLMLKTSGRDSFIAVSICLVIELLSLFILLLANKFAPNYTVFQLCERALSRIGSKIFCCVIALYLIFKLLLITNDIKVFFTVSVFENMPWVIYIIPLLALFAIISCKGLKALARTCEIFTPLVAASVVIMCLLMVFNINFENLIPILANGFAPVAKSIVRFPLWYGDFSVFILFLGKLKRSKHTNLITMVSGSIAALVVLFFSIMVFAAYANVPNLLRYGQNVSNLTQITLSGFNLGRLDILVFCIWMVSVFVKGVLVFYLLCRTCEYLVSAKVNKVTGIVVAVLIYALNVFVFPNEVIFKDLLINVVNFPTLIVQYTIPLVPFIGSLRLKNKVSMLSFPISHGLNHKKMRVKK